MSSHTSSISVTAAGNQASRGVVSLYMELTKARLSALVLVTTAVGFILASPLTQIDWMRLTWTLLGTGLAAGCANALNQLVEVDRDRRMIRTRRRPLPGGLMTRSHAFHAAMAMGSAGLVILTVKANLAAAWLALATILIYVLVYTPLKTRSTLNTLAGAVCGGIPPMIGWVAGSGSLDGGAWLLAAMLFVWQLPHFLALAWLYREDYARGGFAMLPVIDRPDGRLTCRVIVLTCFLLVPLSMLAPLLQIGGALYTIGSILLGFWMLILCVRLYFHRTDANARGVFLASIAYLPVIMFLMVIDR